MGGGISAQKEVICGQIFSELDRDKDNKLCKEELMMFKFAFQNAGEHDGITVVNRLILEADNGTGDAATGDASAGQESVAKDGKLDPTELAAWFRGQDYSVLQLRVMLHSIRLHKWKRLLPHEKAGELQPRQPFQARHNTKKNVVKLDLKPEKLE